MIYEKCEDDMRDGKLGWCSDMRGILVGRRWSLLKKISFMHINGLRRERASRYPICSLVTEKAVVHSYLFDGGSI